jgi:uridine kinase
MELKLQIGHWATKGRLEASVHEGDLLLDLSHDQRTQAGLPIIGALYNNEVVDLFTPVTAPGTVSWLDMSSEHGMLIYKQSLVMLLAQAVRELFPQWQLDVHHSFGKHCYCELDGTSHPSARTLELIARQMNLLIERDEPIIPRYHPASEAIPMLEKAGYGKTADLLARVGGDRICIYTMGGQIFHSFYALAPSAGCLRIFGLEPHDRGFLLRYPTTAAPMVLAPLVEMPKVASVLRQTKNWTRIVDVYNVPGLYQTASKGPDAVRDLIHVSEALQEKYLVNLADQIYEDRDRLRVILIAGPSSSGKTTFCYRLAIQLKVLGLRPKTLSTDNYFVNRWETPRNPDGSMDYESLHAVNIGLFNDNLSKLISGEELKIPIFDFVKGERIEEAQSMRLEPGHPLIIEGIHALNEALTPSISRGMKHKIYISSMVQIDIDSYNRVATSDSRLLRRIVRDHQYRGRSAVATLMQWPSVRQGEVTNIFPFQEEADSLFNTGLLYETAVFKKHAEPLLRQVSADIEEYADAQRLLKILSYFPHIDDAFVPLNSILREFIGGSSIHEG